MATLQQLHSTDKRKQNEFRLSEHDTLRYQSKREVQWLKNEAVTMSALHHHMGY